MVKKTDYLSLIKRIQELLSKTNKIQGLPFENNERKEEEENLRIEYNKLLADLKTAYYEEERITEENFKQFHSQMDIIRGMISTSMVQMVLY